MNFAKIQNKNKGEEIKINIVNNFIWCKAFALHKRNYII